MEPQDKATDHQKTKHQLFNGDGFRLLLLTMLYSVQGFAFGFIDITMPVILKKHFNYSEVGVITWCCIPFSIKFIFAPFVDTYFLKCVGKRRSWILPTQLLLVAINLYAASNIINMYFKVVK